MTQIERLPLPADDRDLAQLARLLLDAIGSGAAVSFLATLTEQDAVAWWRDTLGRAHRNAVFLIARDELGICGSVQMHPAWAPNQPHRAEIVKLLVHRRARRRGLGERLMHEIEGIARAQGRTLLTLDARRGGAAEALYRKLGWVHAGTIPEFALDPDGVTPHDAVIFYKRLAGPSGG